jgi:GntR family transcriptional regulator/MocR family aminotransferase
MEDSHTNLAWETLLELPTAGPMHVRLAAAVRSAIRSGRIGAASTLPPSRVLAATLGCSRWVVTQAYAQLATEGYLAGRTGSATRVRWSPGVAAAGPRDETAASRPRYDLAPGLPDLRAFPRRRWAEALSRAATEATDADLGLPPAGGAPALRAGLADYLARSRGAVATPGTVVVCGGIRDGVARLCRGLVAAGHTMLAVEDPGWGALRAVAAEAGLTVAPVPVDDAGLRVAQIPPEVRAALVSPAHQFPTGAVLSPARRAALVDWARSVDGLILEDEYDAEFRYDRRPVGCLQGLDPDRVALFGSANKILAPAIGIGWAVAPPRWQAALSGPGGPPTLDQMAFAAFLRTGRYDRHLHGCRLRYRARRDALVAALARHLPGARVNGVSAGLHLVIDLPGLTEQTAVDRSAALGVAVMALGDYRVTPGRAGLVLGYGNLADAAVEHAVTLLAAAADHSGVAGDEVREHPARLGHHRDAQPGDEVVDVPRREVAGVLVDTDAGDDAGHVQFGMELGGVHVRLDPEHLHRAPR